MVMNITNYSIVYAFSGDEDVIHGATFIDPENRFIYMEESPNIGQIYDRIAD